MKKLLIFILLFPCLAFAQTSQLKQQIEILQYELSLLQMLVNNMGSVNINSPSYLAFNIEDGQKLVGGNSQQIRPIASITKLMTAVVTKENLDLNKVITINEEMQKPLGYSPTIFTGAKITVQKLMQAQLIQSTNDASESLAVSFGKDNFLSLMNQKARSLGMNSTSFHDVYGLSSLNKSSAEDLAKLLSYIYKNHPDLLSITRDNNFYLANEKGELMKFRNINNFYHLSFFVGGKTGYHNEARQTIAGVFRKDNKDIGVVILYSLNRQADVFALLKRI